MIEMRALRVLCLAWLAAGLAAPAAAKPPETAAWLADLDARVAGDLAAGKSLVVEVHVPLCDSAIIACGNAKLGDGDNPDTNLYWATTPGFGAWFARRHSGWTKVVALAAGATGDPDVLALHVYRRTVATPAAWRAAGAPATYELDLVVHAWRGKAIDRALAAYAADVSGGPARTVATPTGAIAAGGAAQLVAFVGHNRLMDLDGFAWPAPPPASDPKGAIAIACDTAPYMKTQVSAATRVPLLLTADLLFANAAPLEAAVLAFAQGGGYRQIRLDAATAYAGIRAREVKHVVGAFTNPADPRW